MLIYQLVCSQCSSLRFIVCGNDKPELVHCVQWLIIIFFYQHNILYEKQAANQIIEYSGGKMRTDHLCCVQVISSYLPSEFQCDIVAFRVRHRSERESK